MSNDKEKERGIVVVGGGGARVGLAGRRMSIALALAVISPLASSADTIDPLEHINVGTIGIVNCPIIRAMKAESFNSLSLLWRCPKHHPKDNLIWKDKRFCAPTLNFKSYNMRNKQRPHWRCARSNI